MIAPTRDVMEEILEAAESGLEGVDDGLMYDALVKIEKLALAALSEGTEPVAWLWECGRCGDSDATNVGDPPKAPPKCRSCYATLSNGLRVIPLVPAPTTNTEPTR